MFVLEKERLVKAWPAVVRLPVDGGEVIEEKITLDFIVLSGSDALNVVTGGADALKKVVTGWSNITDENNNPLIVNDNNKDALFGNQFFIIAAVKAYQQAIHGLSVKSGEES